MYLGHLWHIVAAATLAVAAPSRVVPRGKMSSHFQRPTCVAQANPSLRCFVRGFGTVHPLRSVGGCSILLQQSRLYRRCDYLRR